MESLSRSHDLFLDPDPLTSWPAPAEAAYTLLAVMATPGVVAVSFAAFGVSVLLRNSVREESPVAQAVDVCNSCKKEREKAGEPPRTLIRLPIEVTQSKMFKRKGMPIRLCEHCDGDALLAAQEKHEKGD
jgi:hypothetical protein